MSPDTTMPKFKLDDDELGKIVAFLLTMPSAQPPERLVLDAASPQEGERLFTERGCHGCHAVNADEHSVSPRVPHLAGIGSKVTPEWLDHWIADPKAYNPDTAMPKLQLTDAERHSIIAYLLTLKRAEPLPAVPDLSPFKTEDGKQLVKRYECFGCHAIEGFEKVRPSVPNLGEFARKPVDELDFGTLKDVPRTKWDWLDRKLREPWAYETDKIELLMPQIHMTDDERRAVMTDVLAADGRALPGHYLVPSTEAKHALREVTWMTGRFNCNGCHRLNGRDPHIAQWLERKSQTGPTLEGVGARLQGQYMYQFVLEPKPVRPWLKMRMPTFGFSEAQARTLVEGFAAAATVTNPYTYVAKENIPPDHFQRGIRRFQHYKCVQCHPTAIDQGLPKDVDPEDLSINLTLSKARLRPEWIKDFLAHPKQIAGAQTRMPTVFYSVEGDPKVEKPKEDIDDITLYLMGMVEPPELTLQAEDEKKAEEVKKEQATDWSKVEY